MRRRGANRPGCEIGSAGRTVACGLASCCAWIFRTCLLQPGNGQPTGVPSTTAGVVKLCNTGPAARISLQPSQRSKPETYSL
jgi:hypothetical protein